MKQFKLLTIISILFISQSLVAQTDGADFFLNILTPYYESIPSSEIGGAQFGGSIDTPIYGELAYATNGIDSLACTSVNSLSQKIALVDRGECLFVEKAINVEVAGAIACIICNFNDEVVTMANLDSTVVTIPTIMLSSSDCQNLKDALNSGEIVELGLSTESSPVSKIIGQVAHDENLNCTVDSGENSLGNFKVTVEKDNYTRTTYTDAFGNYKLFVDTGNYVVQVIPPSFIWTNCSVPVNVSFPDYELEETVNLPIESVLSCPALTVDIASPILRRCFENNFYVDYCNVGSVVAENAFVTLTLDPLFTIVSSSIPYVENNNDYTFELGDVEYGACSAFQYVAELSCDAELGMTFCSIAQIFPDDGCALPAPDWDGVDIAMQGTCDNNDLQFSILNKGADMTTPLNYRVIRNAEIWEEGTFLLNEGDAQLLNFSADGATYRVEANQSENHPWNNLPSATVEGCATNGIFETGFYSMFPVADYGDTYDELCQEVVGSYDPNDKQGFPRGYGDEHYIYQNVDLQYLIRFQNTGTDTAFTVKITDEISEYLDLNTFRPGASSHSYIVDIIDREISFTFDNIMLPDSFVNEPASNGWIEFEISQNVDVPLETLIENSAGIYFDFNDPIITNTTFHRVGDDFLPITVETKEVIPENFELILSPNPVRRGTAVFIEGNFNQNSAYNIFRIDGQQIDSGRTNNGQVHLSEKLIAGVYLLKLTNAEGQIEVGRFVIY